MFGTLVLVVIGGAIGGIWGWAARGMDERDAKNTWSLDVLPASEINLVADDDGEGSDAVIELLEGQQLELRAAG